MKTIYKITTLVLVWLCLVNITTVYAQPDPCLSIAASNPCGISNTTIIPAGGGLWTNGPFSPPGQEKVYTFTPTVTGNYTITQTTNTVGTWIDYFYKPTSGGCNSTGWTFLQDMSGAPQTSFNTMALTAGISYYIYLDPENTSGGTDRPACSA